MAHFPSFINRISQDPAIRDEAEALVRWVADQFPDEVVSTTNVQLLPYPKGSFRGWFCPPGSKRPRQADPSVKGRSVLLLVNPSFWSWPVRNLRWYHTVMPSGTTREEAEHKAELARSRGFKALVDEVKGAMVRGRRGAKYFSDKYDGDEHRFRVSVLCPYGGQYSPLITIHSWQEALVEVAAHEYHHAVQHEQGRTYWEYECERAGLEILERWRSEQVEKLAA